MSFNFALNDFTAEQLEALIAQAKKQKKNAKNKKQIEEEKKRKQVVDAWEEIDWDNYGQTAEQIPNDERLRILCAHYGLKVAHKRKGRHQERTLGDSTNNRPNGQYSNIVANCEERFKYELMGNSWRGAKIYKGKGKSKVYVGTEFDLQKAFKPIWGKLTNPQKKAVWHHKFSNEWWKVGDDASLVDAPTERTNSKAFMIWWDEHVVRMGDKWVFKGNYGVEKDFMKYFYLAIKEDKKPVKQSAKAPVPPVNTGGGGGAKPETKKKTKEQEDAQKFLTEHVGKSAVRKNKKTKAKADKKKAKAEKKQSKAEDEFDSEIAGFMDEFVEE